MPTIDPSSRTDSDPGDDDVDVGDKARDLAEEYPWIGRVTRLGWIAKGLVYFLMGTTAISIARQQPTGDEASPTGSLAKVGEQTGGPILLGALAVGLVLYCLWRVLTVAVIRGNDLDAWAERIGYTVSAASYAVLALVAIQTVLAGSDTGRSNTVERVSRRLMEAGWGRWVLGAAGIAVVALGCYFVVRKALMRGFCDDLTAVDPSGGDATFDRILVGSGVVGWFGRGVVTVLVGVFVTRAAIRFDPDDAQGYDGALRDVAASTTGTVLVWCSAIGLVAYGVFCLLSHRRRTIETRR